MATLTVAFSLEMLTFGHPESWAHSRESSTRGKLMATLTVPFCLEMLTFGHPESSGALQSFHDAGRAYGHSHNAFLLGIAYILATQKARHTSANPRRGEGLWPLSQCLLVWKCLHLATQKARHTSETQLGGTLRFRTRGGCMATRTVLFCFINAYIWPPREPWRTFGRPECLFAL